MSPDIIAILQGRGLVSTVSIEPYLGQGGAGPLYGPAVPVDAFVDWKRRRVRNALGKEVVAEGTVYCRLDVTAPEKSRVTASGRVAYVIASHCLDGGGLPVPSHLQLALT